MKATFLFLFSAFMLVCNALTYGQAIRSTQYTEEHGLSDNTVFRLAQDTKDGHLWLGTDYGLNRFDGTAFKQYPFQKLSKSQSILAILPLKDGSLALSYYRDGLYFLKDDTLTALPASFVKDSVHDVFLKVSLDLVGVEGAMLALSMGNVVSIGSNRAEILYFDFCKHIRSDNDGGAYISNEIGISHFTKNGQKQILDYSDVTLLDHNETGLFFSVKNAVFHWDMTDKEPERLFILEGKKDISALMIDTRHRLWCSTHEGGLYYYQSGQLKLAHEHIGDSTTVVNDLLEDKEGNIWVATNARGLFGIFTEDPLTILNSDISFRTLLGSRDGSIYAGGFRKLLKWDGILLSEQNTTLSYNETVYDMHELPGGDILIGSTFSLSRVSDQTFVSSKLTNGTLAMQPLTNGDILLGSFHGIASYDQTTGSVQKKRLELRSRINRFFKYKEAIWCLTDTGVFIWQDSGNYQRPKELSSYNGGKINDICLDHLGALCLATNTGFYKETGEAWLRLTQQHGLPSDLCHTLEMDGNGFIWIGTHRGIACVDPKGDLKKLDYFQTLAHSKVRDLIFDDENNLFLACENALLMLNPTELFNSMPTQPVLLEGIGSNEHLFSPSSENIQFDHSETPITVTFYTNSFKYAKDIEYEYRLANKSEIWSKTKERTVTYASLPPGNYLFEVRAKHWASEDFSESKSVSFEIVPALWMTAWFKALLGITTLLIATSILILRLRRLKKNRLNELGIERRINQLKFQALSASMSPHFVQNVLSSVISYFHDQPAQETRTYIEEFSGLIRLNLRHVQDSYIELDDEIERLKLYLNIIQRRHEGRFEYEIDSKGLDTEETMIPNMAVQPFVENALWHGLLPLERKGKLLISFREIKELKHNFEIVVEDNGIGIHQSSKKASTTGNSIGISTTIERVQLLHKSNRVEIEEIQNPISKEVQGTKVVILLCI